MNEWVTSVIMKPNKMTPDLLANPMVELLGYISYNETTDFFFRV